MRPNPRRPFLTAEWRDLILLNYETPESLLAPLVPAGTELDTHEGRLMVSLVGFRFLNTRLMGLPLPGYRHFEEVNLRFYVRRTTPEGELRRAVVFIRELVPKRAVAWIAKKIYNEPYLRVPMRHTLQHTAGRDWPCSVDYGWTFSGSDFSLAGELAAAPAPLPRPSEAEFITEHYWGYTAQRDGGTLEYQVEHPPWQVAPLNNARLLGPSGALYGHAWEKILSAPPRSAFYAEGSPVRVHKGVRL